MKSLFQQFADWVDQQNPARKFDPYDADECVGAQFLRAMGYPVGKCWVATWDDLDGNAHSFPDDIFHAIDWACQRADRGSKTTFGALSTRLASSRARSAAGRV